VLGRNHPRFVRRVLPVLSVAMALCAPQAARAAWAPPGQIPIYFWCGPPTRMVTDSTHADARVAEYKGAGGNLLLPPCEPGVGTTAHWYGTSVQTDVAATRRVLDAAAANGIEVIVGDARIEKALAGDLSGLAGVISDYAGYSALAGYYVTDEPTYPQLASVGTVVRYLQSHDPGHYGFVNAFPNYASSDALGGSYDGYQDALLTQTSVTALDYDNYREPTSYDNLVAARQAATAHDVPFRQSIHVGGDPSLPQPLTPQQILKPAMQMLAYGAKGVGNYFYWSDSNNNPATGSYADYAVIGHNGERTSHYDWVSQNNAQLQNIGKQLLNASNRYTFENGSLDRPGMMRRPAGARVRITDTTSKLTVGFFGATDATGYVYTLVTNRDDTSPVATGVQLSYGSALPEVLSSAGTWSTVTPSNAGSGVATIPVSLPASGGILFRTHTPLLATDETWDAPALTAAGG
jgi:hypothetical protein